VGFVATEKVMDTATKSQHPDGIVPLPPSDSGMEELEANGAASGVEGKEIYATTGMSSAEDLNKDTDPNIDYKTHKYLDLNKPLLMQVWNGGFSRELP